MSERSEAAIALLIDHVIRDVAELPDRTSPDDNPDTMLVTTRELRDILWQRLLEKPADIRRRSAESIP